MEDRTTNIFYHLLMGKQPPAIDDIRIRCEGMRELKILDDACKLAAYRHYRETVLIEAHVEIFAGFRVGNNEREEKCSCIKLKG